VYVRLYNLYKSGDIEAATELYNRFLPYLSFAVQHLEIGIRTMEILREEGLERLHSRKLRSFIETAFR